MDKFGDFIRHGGRLRMMASLCVVFCIVYVISMGTYTFSKERTVRAEAIDVYLDELAVFEFFDGNWDDWVAENGEAVVEAAYGKRPTLPVEPGVQFNVLFEGFSHIFLVLMLSAFVAFIMSSLAQLNVGMHYLLKELDEAINDPDGSDASESAGEKEEYNQG